MPKAKAKVVTADDEVFKKTLQSAINLSTSDRMGAVAKKAVELMQTLIRSDADPEQVFFAVDSLKAEREIVMRWDEESTSPLRQKLYTLFESLETALRWYAEREQKLKGEEVVKKEEPLENSDTTGSSLFTVSAAGTSAVKEEEDVRMKSGESKKDEAIKRKRIVVKEEIDEDEEEDQTVKKKGKDASPKKEGRKRIKVKEEIEEDEEADEEQQERMKKKRDAWTSRNETRKRPKIKVEEEEDSDDTLIVESVTSPESGMARRVRKKIIRDFAHCFEMSLEDPIWLRDDDAVEFSEWMEYWESPEGMKKGGAPKADEMNLTIDMNKEKSVYKVKSEDIETARTNNESAMAREVRLKLTQEYADCGMSFDGAIWLKDEDAVKFRDWMDYWESNEGRKLGGPPKVVYVKSE